MLYTLFLVLHLAGAGATGIAASYTGVVLWKREDASYRMCALILGILATFEILSGVALAVISFKITAPSLCANIILYLSIVAFIETLLFFRMKKISMSFPLTQILSPIAASLMLLIAAIAYGL